MSSTHDTINDMQRHITKLKYENMNRKNQNYDLILEIEKAYKQNTKIGYFVYFLIFMFGLVLILAIKQRGDVMELEKASEKVYQDNKVLVDMFEKQNKGYNTLIKHGWSKERADAFITDGCMMRLEVGE